MADVNELARARGIIQGQQDVLELITRGKPLPEILKSLAQLIERHSRDGLLASILLLDKDGVHLRHGAAPSLPERYNRVVDGFRIGPSAGSCGSAAYRRAPVEVSDIATDPLWAGCKDVALREGLRACWSTPILSSDDRVLGTFALYYREPRGPSPEDLELVSLLARTASIAISMKQADDELQAKRYFIERMTEAVPLLLYVYDLVERRNVYSNQQSINILGYTSEELAAIGPHLAEVLTHPDDAKFWSGMTERQLNLKDGEVLEYEYRLRRNDGRWRWVYVREVAFARTPEGKVRQVLGTAQDITERKLAEEALRQSEGRLRSITDNAPDFIIQMDRDGMITFVNRTMAPLTVDQVRGTSVFKWIPEENHAMTRDALARVFETGEPQQYSAIVTALNRWFSTRVSPVTVDGEVVSAISISRDITDHKLATEKLKNEEKLLRNLLNLHERERQLVAYELHDGLVQDIVGAQLLLEAAYNKLATVDASRTELNAVRSLLNKAINEGRRMVSDLRPLIIDERGIVDAINFVIVEEESRDGITIDFLPDLRCGRLAPMLEGTIFRIIQEALANVKRHSKADSAEVRLIQQGDRVLVAVHDEGVGFNLSEIPEDRFGLEGIRKRAELFGGEVKIESSPGHGTRVSVNLPLLLATQSGASGWAEVPGSPAEQPMTMRQ